MSTSAVFTTIRPAVGIALSGEGGELYARLPGCPSPLAGEGTHTAEAYGARSLADRQLRQERDGLSFDDLGDPGANLLQGRVRLHRLQGTGIGQLPQIHDRVDAANDAGVAAEELHPVLPYQGKECVQQRGELRQRSRPYLDGRL